MDSPCVCKLLVLRLKFLDIKHTNTEEKRFFSAVFSAVLNCIFHLLRAVLSLWQQVKVPMPKSPRKPWFNFPLYGCKMLLRIISVPNQKQMTPAVSITNTVLLGFAVSVGGEWKSWPTRFISSALKSSDRKAVRVRTSLRLFSGIWSNFVPISSKGTGFSANCSLS